MNEASITVDFDLNTPYKGGNIVHPDEVKISHNFVPKRNRALPSDLNTLRDFVLQHQNYTLSLTIGEKVELNKPIIIDLELDETSSILIDYIEIHAEAQSRADVVIRYYSNTKGSHFHSGFSSVWADSSAQVNLYKIEMLGEEDIDLDGSAITVAENGEGNCLHCVVGAKQVVSGCNISLVGKESRATLDSLYVGKEGCSQDFNYRVELQGAHSEGKIVCRGALLGNAKKALKSTLDFLRGASGAKGREEESVLSLSVIGL